MVTGSQLQSQSRCCTSTSERRMFEKRIACAAAAAAAALCISSRRDAQLDERSSLICARRRYPYVALPVFTYWHNWRLVTDQMTSLVSAAESPCVACHLELVYGQHRTLVIQLSIFTRLTTLRLIFKANHDSQNTLLCCWTAGLYTVYNLSIRSHYGLTG